MDESPYSFIKDTNIKDIYFHTSTYAKSSRRYNFEDPALHDEGVDGFTVYFNHCVITPGLDVLLYSMTVHQAAPDTRRNTGVFGTHIYATAYSPNGAGRRPKQSRMRKIQIERHPRNSIVGWTPIHKFKRALHHFRTWHRQSLTQAFFRACYFSFEDEQNAKLLDYFLRGWNKSLPASGHRPRRFGDVLLSTYTELTSKYFSAPLREKNIYQRSNSRLALKGLQFATSTVDQPIGLI